jgi:putative transposase
VATLLEQHTDEVTDDGRRRLVRHGHLPERESMTAIGPVAVRCPRVRPRRARCAADPILVGNSFAPCMPIEKPGGPDSDSLPQGHLDRRL